MRCRSSFCSGSKQTSHHAQSTRYEHSVTPIDKAKRALHIAISLGDTERVMRTRDVLLALEDQVADDSSPGTWGFCFDSLVEPPNKRILLGDSQRDKVIDDLE